MSTTATDDGVNIKLTEADKKLAEAYLNYEKAIREWRVAYQKAIEAAKKRDEALQKFEGLLKLDEAKEAVERGEHVSDNPRDYHPMLDREMER